MVHPATRDATVFRAAVDAHAARIGARCAGAEQPAGSQRMCSVDAVVPTHLPPPHPHGDMEAAALALAAAATENANMVAIIRQLQQPERMEYAVSFFFRAAIASGLVTVILRTFSAPLPKRVVLNAFARTRRMRL